MSTLRENLFTPPLFSSKSIHWGLKTLFLLGLALFPYFYQVGSELILISSILGAGFYIDYANIHSPINKQSGYLICAILSTIFSIKLAYWFNHSLIPPSLLHYNHRVESAYLYGLIIFLVLILSPQLVLYQKAINLTLIIATLPLIFFSVFVNIKSPSYTV